MKLGFNLAYNCNNINSNITIYLSGDLGTGKTTIAQGFMQFFNIFKVKSPTYSIVESYQITNRFVHHFDCYRINNPDELEYLGIRDYQHNNNICLFEWAEKASKVINKPDLIINLLDKNDGFRYISVNKQSNIASNLVNNIFNL